MDLPWLAMAAAIVRMKTRLSIEAMRAIEKKRLTPRQLEEVLDVLRRRAERGCTMGRFRE